MAALRRRNPNRLMVSGGVGFILLLWAGVVGWNRPWIIQWIGTGSVLGGERAGATRCTHRLGAGESLWGGDGAHRVLLAVQGAHHSTAGRNRQRLPAGRKEPKPPLATGRMNGTARKAHKAQTAHEKWRAFFTSQFCQLPIVKYNAADHLYLHRPVVGTPPAASRTSCACATGGVSYASLHHSSDECWWRRERFGSGGGGGGGRGHMMTSELSHVGWVCAPQRRLRPGQRAGSVGGCKARRPPRSRRPS
jgi:hypothetical protein